MTKNDGGPAFPETIAAALDGDVYNGRPGMSLRDFFAAVALHGVVGGLDAYHQEPQIAKSAYKIADAMLAEREKTE